MAKRKAPSTILEAATTVCRLLELGDNRLLASDGPAGGQLPDLSPDEWGIVYDAAKYLCTVGARIHELEAERDAWKAECFKTLAAMDESLTNLRHVADAVTGKPR